MTRQTPIWLHNAQYANVPARGRRGGQNENPRGGQINSEKNDGPNKIPASHFAPTNEPMAGRQSSKSLPPPTKTRRDTL